MKPPILLVHGACSQPAHLEPWRVAFARTGFEVVAPALPGHLPGDEAALARLTLRDCLAALRDASAGFGRPPVVIGHSLGGLLALHLAAATDCAGIVLVGSMPTGTVPLSPGALPWLAPLAPAILAGRPFAVPRDGLERLALHDLARAEQDELLPDFVKESGRLYRQILFGGARLPADAVRGPVLVVHGAADRLIPVRVARGLARRYRGELAVIPNHGHWLVAGSLAAIVLPVIGDWIARISPGA